MKINEIFYSLQGEGAFVGNAAIFIRFSGCNLNCDFCDTNHKFGKEMNVSEIWEEIKNFPAALVVLTGGEPALQKITDLVDFLRSKNKIIAIETNGTRPIPKNVNWITLSPKFPYIPKKEIAKLHIKKANELKIVIPSECEDIAKIEKFMEENGNFKNIQSNLFYLQPCDTGDTYKNEKITNAVLDYIKKNPTWKLSLQTQKILKMR